MSIPLDYRGHWSKARYDWKRQVNGSKTLSRTDKLLAIILCDDYANHRTACCWPGNRLLAETLNLSTRSVQRSLANLTKERWLTTVRIKNRRRSLQLTFGDGRTGGEHDTKITGKMSETARKRDSGVRSYIEPKNNLGATENKKQDRECFSTVLIAEKESLLLNAWRDWIATNIDADASVVLAKLLGPGGYLLPSRHPGTCPKKQTEDLRYFDRVMRSEKH